MKQVASYRAHETFLKPAAVQYFCHFSFGQLDRELWVIYPVPYISGAAALTVMNSSLLSYRPITFIACTPTSEDFDESCGQHGFIMFSSYQYSICAVGAY